MSQQPAEEPRRRLGNRRRKEESDDDDDTTNNNNNNNNNIVVVEPSQHEQQQKPMRRKAPKAMEAALPPPAAAATALHTDPMAPLQNNISSANANTNNTQTTIITGGTTSGGGLKVLPPVMGAAISNSSTTTAAAAAGAAMATADSEDIFEMSFDTFTADDLYALLERHTRQDVEKQMIEHEQMQRKQQQAPQVERFLDAPVRTTVGSSSNNNNNNNNNSESAEEMGGYRYNDMLQRLFVALNRNKESSAMSERNQLPVPQLEKIGKKKVIITNFGRICQTFHRPIEDVKDYIEKELSVGGNLDSNNALILKYEVQKTTAFDKILIKYLDEYVKCNSCHKIDTTLTKEGRRMELRCNWCTATRSVQAVGSATYSAQVGKRSKARLQALTL